MIREWKPDLKSLPGELRALELAERDMLDRSLKGEIKRPEHWQDRRRELAAYLELARLMAEFVIEAHAEAFEAWAATKAFASGAIDRDELMRRLAGDNATAGAPA